MLLKSTFKYKNNNLEGSDSHYSRQIEDSAAVSHEPTAATVSRRRPGPLIEGPLVEADQIQNKSGLYDLSADTSANVGRTVSGPVRATHMGLGSILLLPQSE